MLGATPVKIASIALVTVAAAEFGPGIFTANDMGTFVAIGLVFLGQWFTYRRWLHDREAMKRSEQQAAALEKKEEQEERNRQFNRVDEEFKSVYKQIGEVRLQLATALGELPKRAEIEHIVELRISPLISATKEQAQTFSRLTLELARVGATMPHRRHDDTAPAGG